MGNNDRGLPGVGTVYWIRRGEYGNREITGAQGLK